MILESGKTKWFALGVAFEGYKKHEVRWREGTVEYHGEYKRIFDAEEPFDGKNTTGIIVVTLLAEIFS